MNYKNYICVHKPSYSRFCVEISKLTEPENSDARICDISVTHSDLQLIFC